MNQSLCKACFIFTFFFAIFACKNAKSEQNTTHTEGGAKSAFAQRFPKAQDITWDSTETGVVANFFDGKHDSKATFDALGVFQYSAVFIEQEALPQAVQNYLKEKYKIVEIALIKMVDNGQKKTYQIEIESNTDYINIEFDNNGKLLKETKQPLSTKEMQLQEEEGVEKKWHNKRLYILESNSSFTIRLEKFEGPFDLLLFFIERDELDIYDIPIAQITKDFLAYIHQAELLNIDLASDFIVVAATLMRIKAKMLVPRKPVDEEGNEIDPREELVSRLLEYKRYKSVLEEMRSLENDRAQREGRGNITIELKEIAVKALVDNELESVTLFKLLRVFEKLMRQFEDEKNRPVHRIYTYNYTVESQREYIFGKIPEGGKADFRDLFSGLDNRIHAIVTFLALLEMLNTQIIEIVQGEGINNFWLMLPSNEDEEIEGNLAEEIGQN